ncbi:MAG: methyltransferase domain-containing protein [Legionella sp.]|uniref:class I SAM-dependent methyltransferase n=1 Tax=Legionella sp. TaxID=459 RepID=UPI00284066F6|nr:methyltransferase domain-containing protein [Legionella sp.]
MTTAHVSMYRLKTALRSLIAIYRLPQEQVDAFLRSYESFNKEMSDENEEQSIANYYSVLNHLCALGEVEKMYIPPVMDLAKGIFDNQMLFEEKMSHDLNIKEGDKVLDMGCGRGRVAAHVATMTHAHVTGFNIDDVQLESAKEYASLNQLTDKCQFIKANLNEPLPFENDSFDSLYQIQVLTYAKNKEQLFAEMFRVLKPGGKISFLDWVQLDNYDTSNAHHRDLLKRVKPLIGAIDTPTPDEIKNTLEKVGFKILLNKDISVGGHQAPLIEKADKYYEHMQKLVYFMVKLHLLPKHFKILFDRFAQDGESFIEADQLGLFTTSCQTIAEKPGVSLH